MKVLCEDVKEKSEVTRKLTIEYEPFRLGDVDYRNNLYNVIFDLVKDSMIEYTPDLGPVEDLRQQDPWTPRDPM